jgi:hypothetical protein
VFPVVLLLAPLMDPPPPPAEAGRLAAFVGNLNHPRYVVREQASKRLVEAGGTAKGVLRSAAASGDPETAARAKACLEAVVGVELEALRPFPEIDAAWYSVPDHTYSLPRPPDMSAHLRAVGGGSPFPWDTYFQACENWSREKLTAGTSPRLLRLILAEMHRRDGWFISRAGHEEPPYPVDPDEYRAARPTK